MKKNQFIIGIDIDNTICDSYPAYLEKYNLRFHKKVKLTEVLDFYYLNDLANREGAEFGSLVEELVLSEEFQISLIPIEEALKVIQGWVKEGIKIHYVTARPVKMRKVTENWLIKHGFWFSGSKLDMWDEKKGFDSDTDFKVDMAQKHNHLFFIEDIRDIAVAMKIRAFLVDRPWNQGVLPPHVRRVYSWDEIRETVSKESWFGQ